MQLNCLISIKNFWDKAWLGAVQETGKQEQQTQYSRYFATFLSANIVAIAFYIHLLYRADTKRHW